MKIGDSSKQRIKEFCLFLCHHLICCREPLIKGIGLHEREGQNEVLATKTGPGGG